MRTQWRWISVGLLSAVAFYGCDNNDTPNLCGNDFCDEGETVDSCARDCGSCGDDICSAGSGETLESCPSDCSVCGDEICSPGETVDNCAADCSACGDSICSAPDEDATTCAADCAPCGDGICSDGETAESCYADCGECGDDVCSTAEDHVTCAQDCTTPIAYCTAVYEILPVSVVSGTPLKAGDGTYELSPSSLTLRYEVEAGSDAPKNAGRVDVLHFWMFNKVSVTSPVPLNTDVFSFTPSCGTLGDIVGTSEVPTLPEKCEALESGERVAHGRWMASSAGLEEVVVWANGIRARQYDGKAGAYVALPAANYPEVLPEDFEGPTSDNAPLPVDSHGIGFLQAVRSVGNISCMGAAGLCSMGRLGVGDNVQNTTHNQPWETFFLRDGGKEVQLELTRVPNGQPALSHVRFTGERKSVNCD